MASLSIFEAEKRFPNRVALIVQGRTRSYRDLAARARQALVALRAQGAASGLGPSSPVAWVASNTEDSVAMLWALSSLGVPVVLIHPRLVPLERDRLLKMTGARLLDGSCAVIGETSMGETSSPAASLHHPESIFAVIFSSGTTGTPKGVCLSRRAVMEAARASADNLGWQAGDRWLLSLPMAHIGGLSILTRALLGGRTVVVSDQTSFDVERTIHELEAHRITLTSWVPTVLDRMLRRRPMWTPPAHLRAILLGGAPWSQASREEARKRGWPVLASYGLTEACSQVTTERYGQPPPPKGSGQPLLGTELRIVDQEIQIRSQSLFSGYWGATRSPFGADGWFSTGDLGAIGSGGVLHVLGRKDDVVITGGENVHPTEVETALTSWDRIDDAAVWGAADAHWGQVVVAALAGPKPHPTEAELTAFLATRLAAFKRPKRVRWMLALPRTASGKIDRAALKHSTAWAR